MSNKTCRKSVRAETEVALLAALGIAIAGGDPAVIHVGGVVMQHIVGGILMYVAIRLRRYYRRNKIIKEISTEEQ